MAQAWAKCVVCLVVSPTGQSSTFGTSPAAGTAGRMARLTSDRLRGSTPDILLGFTPLDRLPTKVNEDRIEHNKQCVFILHNQIF